MPAWLEELGYPRPAEQRLDIDIRLRHASAAAAPRRAGWRQDGARLGAARAAARALLVRRGTRQLAAQRLGVRRPAPADRSGRLCRLRSPRSPRRTSRRRSKRGEPLAPVVAHRFPADLRRRYERLNRLPGGLLPFGDAICAFNPVYGQGMTVAAHEAVALRDCLATGPDGLERRFLRAAARTIDDAWTLAVGADLAQPTVAGRRPARVRLVNAYLRRLLAAAAHADETLALAFIGVQVMFDRPRRLLPTRHRRPRPRRQPARPAPTRHASRRASGAHGMTTCELHLDGVRTPLRQAGPADASQAVVFCTATPAPVPTGNRCSRPSARADGPSPGTRRASAPRVRRPGSATPSTRTPASSAERSTPSTSTAPTWSYTTSAARGPCAGRPSTPTASPPRSCSPTTAKPTRSTAGPTSTAPTSTSPTARVRCAPAAVSYPARPDASSRTTPPLGGCPTSRSRPRPSASTAAAAPDLRCAARAARSGAAPAPCACNGSIEHPGRHAIHNPPGQASNRRHAAPPRRPAPHCPDPRPRARPQRTPQAHPHPRADCDGQPRPLNDTRRLVGRTCSDTRMVRSRDFAADGRLGVP